MPFLFLFILVTAPTIAKDGRFQLVRHKEHQAQDIMIDTHTGKMWKQVCYAGAGEYGKCDVKGWELENVIGVNTTIQDMAKQVEAYEKSKN